MTRNFLVQDIRKAREKVSDTIDLPVKIAYTLLRLTGGYVEKHASIKKEALSNSEINRVVDQHLREKELAPLDFDFGKLLLAVVKNTTARTARGDYDREAQQAVASAVFQNLLLGMNLDTGYSYPQGTLGDRVRILRDEQGKPDDQIQRILARVIQQMTQVKIKYDRKSEYSGYENLGPDAEGEEGGASDLFDRVLSLNPLSREEASQWMSLSQKNPVLRDLLMQIDRIIERRADRGQMLVYKTMKANPDFKSIADLEKTLVTIRHPKAGSPVTMTLSDAMSLLKSYGLTKSDGIRYVIEKKIAPMLDKIKPVVLDALRDLDMS